MKELSPTAYVVILYTIVMALGLHVASAVIQTQKVQIMEGVSMNIETLDSPWWSVFFFISILIMTGILLVLIKYKLDLLIKIVAMFAVLYGMSLALVVLLGTPGLIVAVILFAVTLWKRQNLLLFNLTLIFTVVGAGALLGASLSILPSLILLIVLSIYDLLAVFWTKHMVTLAENAKGKLPFMFIIPNKDRTVGLGTGDLAIPLVFTVSVLKDYTLASAITTAAGGLIGLLTLFLYIQKRKRITLPALPPLAIGLIAGFTASLIPTLL